MNSLYKLIRESGASITTFVLISLLAGLSSLLAVLPPHFLGAALNVITGAEISGRTTAFSPIALLNEGLSWMVAAVGFTPVALFFIFINPAIE